MIYGLCRSDNQDGRETRTYSWVDITKIGLKLNLLGEFNPEERRQKAYARDKQSCLNIAETIKLKREGVFIRNEKKSEK